MEQESDHIQNEAWYKAFKMIELENRLSNHRISTILIINGFLFLAFIFGIDCLIRLTNSSVENLRVNNILITVMIAINAVVCVVGATSSWSIKEGISAAYLQIVEAKKWLEKVSHHQGHLVTHPYPPVTGKKLTSSDIEEIKDLSSGNLIIPQILVYVWVSFLFIDIFFALKLHHL